jgi:hypothetical protein
VTFRLLSGVTLQRPPQRRIKRAEVRNKILLEEHPALAGLGGRDLP